MNPEQVQTIQCPSCWESIDIMVDCSVNSQRYIEDCQICCQPILLTIEIDPSGEIAVDAQNGNE